MRPLNEFENFLGKQYNRSFFGVLKCRVKTEVSFKRGVNKKKKVGAVGLVVFYPDFEVALLVAADGTR